MLVVNSSVPSLLYIKFGTSSSSLTRHLADSDECTICFSSAMNMTTVWLVGQLIHTTHTTLLVHPHWVNPTQFSHSSWHSYPELLTMTAKAGVSYSFLDHKHYKANMKWVNRGRNQNEEIAEWVQSTIRRQAGSISLKIWWRVSIIKTKSSMFLVDYQESADSVLSWHVHMRAGIFQIFLWNSITETWSLFCDIQMSYLTFFFIQF